MKDILKKQLELHGTEVYPGKEIQTENILLLQVAKELELVYGGQIKITCMMKLIVCL